MPPPRRRPGPSIRFGGSLTRFLLAIGAAALLVLGFAAGALVHVGVNSLWIPSQRPSARRC